MNESELIARIAHMYYIENMDLKKIGKIFNVSYATISRLLKKGRKEGIVKIIISSNDERKFIFESKLKNKFNLKGVFAINVEENYKYDFVLNLIGREAANYLINLLKNGDLLGISWGRTVYNVVNHFSTGKKRNIDVVQLIGSTSNVPIELNSSDLVRRMKNMFSGSYYFINSDAVLDNKDIRDKIYNNLSIVKTLSLHKKINTALIGVGLFNPLSRNFVHRNYMRNDEIEEFNTKNIVGETNFTFFDINGNIINGKFNKRVICIETSDLLKIENKILVAGGIEKAPAILGAIRARLVDILFTDGKTLERICEMIS